jgi:murein DD-endopeptidase MepM/ murein hydrolase activator NlpD
MKKLLAIGDRMGGVVRRPRAYFAVLPVVVPLLLVATNAAGPVQKPLRASALAAAPAPRLEYGRLSAAAAAPDVLPQHSIVLTFEEGDTLDSILVAGGLSRADSAVLNREFGKSIDLRRLRPGNLVRFHHAPDGAIDSVEMKIVGWGELDAARNAAGTFDIALRQVQVQEVETAVAAQIDTSLYEALRLSGEGPQLVQQIVDVFQWDIDFFALQRGDSFSLVVKKRFGGGDLLGYGPIVAARFTHGGQTYEAYRQETPDGRAGYYARNGSPLRKQFLRAPLQFTRITSHFSKSRFHPILHAFRPHHGVDYGAPIGTPAMTTADGVVVEARYTGSQGNFVRIRHSARIETLYMHMSRFAKGIRPGKRVNQGDVIGYVGMTGLATGPHLHYSVTDNGAWLDPAKMKSITPDPLRGASLAEFRAGVARYAPKLAAATPQVAELAARRRALF